MITQHSAQSEMRQLPAGKFVFLGGTVGTSQWRSEFTRIMGERGIPAEMLFNPVVPTWDPKIHGPLEDAAKSDANYHLYCLVPPQNADTGISAFAIAEAIVAHQQRPRSTITVFGDTQGCERHIRNQMAEVERLLRQKFPQSMILPDLQAAADWLAPRLMAIGNPDQPRNKAWRRDSAHVRWIKRKVRRLLNSTLDQAVSVDYYDCRGIRKIPDMIDFIRIAGRAADDLNRAGLYSCVVRDRDGVSLVVKRM